MKTQAQTAVSLGGLFAVACLSLLYLLNDLVTPVVSGKVVSGYQRDNYSNDLIFISPTGVRSTPSTQLQAILRGARFSAFDMPIDPDNESIIYLSSYEIVEGIMSGINEGCISRNRVYQYNLLSGEPTIIHEELSRDGSFYLPSKCRILRLIGRQGDKLILLIDDPDNSPGPCTNVWSDYFDHMLTLDLSKSVHGLVPFVVPLNNIKRGKRDQQKCLEELAL
jgi:hypothetical protein